MGRNSCSRSIYNIHFPSCFRFFGMEVMWVRRGKWKRAIFSDVLGVQDDIIIPRSLLTSYEEDYHPVELLFSVEEGKGEEFETYIDTYYECIKASEYAEGIYYQGQEYRKKYIYNLVSYWGEEPEEPSIGMEAYESVQGETLYLWWDKDCDDELLFSMPKGGGDLAKITKEQSQGNEYPLQEYK